MSDRCTSERERERQRVYVWKPRPGTGWTIKAFPLSH